MVTCSCIHISTHLPVEYGQKQIAYECKQAKEVKRFGSQNFWMLYDVKRHCSSWYGQVKHTGKAVRMCIEDESGRSGTFTAKLGVGLELLHVNHT